MQCQRLPPDRPTADRRKRSMLAAGQGSPNLLHHYRRLRDTRSKRQWSMGDNAALEASPAARLRWVPQRALLVKEIQAREGRRLS